MADLKDMIEQAKEMLGEKAGQSGNILDAAKNMLGDKAGDVLANSDELKKKAKEIVQGITPDSLDEKAGEMVENAFDAIKGMLGKK